ncbi:MAG TPA: DUF4148 domain-containing protein [Roseateles sp.]|nr:DUF4148 domain-containing protein [Roseateles sp.]
MTRFHHISLAACAASSLLAMAAVAQTPAPAADGQPLVAQGPASKANPKPEQLLQAEPPAAGQRPLTRAEVIRELRRARAAGEMDWSDRESTGYMR